MRRACPVCKQHVRVLRDGRIAMHYHLDDLGKTKTCPGSRTREPVET